MTAGMPPEPALRAADLVTRRDALAAGMDSRRYRRLTASGEYVQIWRGCLVRAERWAAATETERLRARHLAYAKVSPARVVFDAESALLLHGYALTRLPERIHVTGVPAPRPNHPAVTGHRCFGDALETATLPGGAEALVEPRAVLEFLLRARQRDALVVADQALARGIPREDLEHRLAPMASRHGFRRARAVLEAADGLSGSVLESVARYEICRLGVPRPSLQTRVETVLGPKYLDMTWRERMVGLEVDGREKYFLYRPTEEVLFEEHRRENALIREGWTIVRTDASEIYRRPDELVARLLRALAGGRD